MSLEIDTRENKIKTLFSEIDPSILEKYQITVKSLDLGDFVFKLGEEAVLVIERKSLTDLYQSITDGRHREQKKRLFSTYPKSKIIFLIEGNIYGEDFSDKKVKIIQSSILNTIIRDNTRIIQTMDIADTFNTLKQIYEKLLKNPEFFQTETQSGGSTITETDDYANTIKLKKKDNMTPQLCQQLWLAQIPGMSTTFASIILEKYTSVPNLITSYNNLETIEEKKKMLVEIPITTKTGKTRKLGKVLAERIYDYIFYS
jgi:ERCC4-type nuclease